MSSSADFAGQALEGRRRQRARHARTFQDPQSPTRRLIARYSRVDWAAPREFTYAVSTTRQMVGASRRKKVTKQEVQYGFRTFTYNGDVIGGLHHQTHTLVSDQAKRACRARPLVKQYLQAMGIPTAEGRGFRAGDLEEAAAHRAELTGPVVVRPGTGAAGVGVSWGVETEEDFHAAWEYATASRTAPLHHSAELLVERHVAGADVRAYVVGENLVAAIARLPLFVLGDGRSTVRGLVDDAVAARAGNSFLARRAPEVDDDALVELGLEPSAVLSAGEMREVSGTSNPLAGGMSLDITADLSEELRGLAVDAMWSVPGLRAGAVDLVVPDLDSSAGAVVVDLSDDADISLHRFPSYGTVRRPAEAVVEQMIQRARR